MTATRSLNPREERRLLHQELSRTQLLDAAEEIFGQKGFHDTTLKEIADRAIGDLLHGHADAATQRPVAGDEHPCARISQSRGERG